MRRNREITHFVPSMTAGHVRSKKANQTRPRHKRGCLEFSSPRLWLEAPAPKTPRNIRTHTQNSLPLARKEREPRNQAVRAQFDHFDRSLTTLAAGQPPGRDKCQFDPGTAVEPALPTEPSSPCVAATELQAQRSNLTLTGRLNLDRDPSHCGPHGAHFPCQH